MATHRLTGLLEALIAKWRKEAGVYKAQAEALMSKGAQAPQHVSLVTALQNCSHELERAMKKVKAIEPQY